MKKIHGAYYEGERSLFKSQDLRLIDCEFGFGESPLKECKNIEASNCVFGWKYPLWYGERHHVSACEFKEEARAGIWYTDGITIQDCRFASPKMIRKCKNVVLKDVAFPNGLETLWWNEGVRGRNVSVTGDYFGMGSSDVSFDGLSVDGSYPFDGGRDILVKNGRFSSKDAFWNCHNVRLEDCLIVGEFFGWNSENVTLIRCKISSHQGFCYMKNLTLTDCEIFDTDLAFEYCENLSVTAKGHFRSVKNPLSGSLKLGQVDEVIFDDPDVKRENTSIILGYDF